MASDRDRLLKAFIAGGKKRRKPRSPFPSYPTGGRNTGVVKGRSDVNMPLYRSRPSEPPRGTLRGSQTARNISHGYGLPQYDRSVTGLEKFRGRTQRQPYRGKRKNRFRA